MVLVNGPWAGAYGLGWVDFSLKPGPKAHVACAWAKYSVDEAAATSHMGHRTPFLHTSPFLSILDTEITLGPEIIANVNPALERVVRRCKDHLRHPGIYAAEAPFGDLANGAGI